MIVLSQWLTLIVFVFFQGIVFAAPFKPGEKIHYNVSQLGLKVGQATLTFVGSQEYRGHQTIRIDFHAQGFNFLDHEQIYLAPETLRPLFVERDLNIFGSRENIVEEYSPGQVKIVKKASGKIIQQVIDKKEWMDNIYAFIYRYRLSGKFELNDTLDTNLPTKSIKIKLLRKEAVVAARTRYNTYYLESDPAQYRIWFEDSDKKIPLRIKGSIGLTNTSMMMTGYEE